MDLPENEDNNELIFHYTCGLCELICTLDEVQTHPCLDDYSKYFVDGDHYFYPRCDDGTILRRSLIDGQEVSVAEAILAESNTEVDNFKTIEERFIEAVRARQPLWNFRLPVAQRNKYTKDELWQEICDLLKGYYTVPDAKKKWKNLYDTFKKYDNQEKDVRSGSAAKPLVKWKYYEVMKFVRDVNLNRKSSISNIMGTEGISEFEEEPNEDDSDSSKSKTPRRSQPIDKLVDALSAPLPAIVLPPPPPLPPAPAPPDRVDTFLMMIGHDLRALNEPMQNEAMFKIYEFIYKFRQNSA